MKDELIRQTIMDTQEDVDEIKEKLDKIDERFMRYKNITNEKNIILFIFLLLNYVGYSQEYIDDSNFDDKINEQSLLWHFGDDETNIVVIEF